MKAEDEPVAVLPMRLNSDALSDLVIGVNGRSFVSVVATTPAAVFTVDPTGDGQDSNLSDGRCDAGNGQCTLRAAIKQTNASPGADAINFRILEANKTIIPNTRFPVITE